jgi:imidazole glycerol-phosphate synthase subunit HisH
MIAVIDYGIGNVASIVNMLKKIGAPAFLATTAEEVQDAEKIILPGVGSFDSGMNKLKKSGLADCIKEHVLYQKKPILGICLGMQMLGRASEEGTEKGLSLLPFDNQRFDFKDIPSLKIPHMGWNYVVINKNHDTIVFGLSVSQRYYFAHSYHAVCDEQEHILMRCEHGYSFPAAVSHKNIYGFQFHPEKSHKFGMSLLDNFARRV